MRILRFFACGGLVCASLVSCQSTNVAQIDRTYGYEQFVGGRVARVEVARGEMKSIESPSPSDVVITVPTGGGAPVEYHRFMLRLQLHNDSGVAWDVHRGDIRLAFTDSTTKVCTTCPPSTGGDWARVPPGEVEELKVPIVLGLPKGVPMSKAENYWIEIKIRADQSGHEVMHRRLALGSYNQGLQLLRFAGAFTVLLLIG